MSDVNDFKDIDIAVRQILSDNISKIESGQFTSARDVEQLRHSGMISEKDYFPGLVHIHQDKIKSDLSDQLFQHKTCEIMQNHRDFGIDLHTSVYVISPQKFTTLALDIERLINKKVDERFAKKVKESDSK